MQDLAPIVLFTYNRPRHTRQVLDALAANPEAAASILYIYCDGPKENAGPEERKKIEEVGAIADAEKRFAKVIISKQERNKGLARSVIDGVSQVIREHKRVIVVEDDILVAPGFLRYMNEALELYEEEEKVGCIHAWNYHLDTTDYPETTFFLRGADCWGWATWERAWDLFEPDGKALLDKITEQQAEFEFDRKGTHPFVQMLRDQQAGRNDSWAVRWHASLFLAGKYCLHPTRTIVRNIGLDNSGIHCGASEMEQDPQDFIVIRKIPVKESAWFFKAYKHYLETINKASENRMNKWRRIRAWIHRALSFVRKRMFKMGSHDKTWSGPFSSWEEASKVCGGYDDELILEKCKNSLLKVKRGEAVYERDSVLFNRVEYNFPVLAGLQRAALGNNDGSLCVLDFGGSLGSTYFQNREFLKPVKDLKWCIVEQDNFVRCGKEYFEDDSLKFFYSMEQAFAFHFPDVLLLSSVLQYLEDPYAFLHKVMGLQVEYIIIDRTSFLPDNEDVLMVQHVPESIYKASYPHWFFSETKFLRQFKTHYEELVRADSIFQLNIDGARSYFRIFKRRNP